MLTRPYRHLTFVALIGLHRITWISHNINISIDLETVHARVEWIPLRAIKNEKQIFRSSTEVSWHYKYSAFLLSLFKFFTLFGGLFLVIITLGSDTISMAY